MDGMNGMDEDNIHKESRVISLSARIDSRTTGPGLPPVYTQACILETTRGRLEAPPTHIQSQTADQARIIRYTRLRFNADPLFRSVANVPEHVRENIRKLSEQRDFSNEAAITSALRQDDVLQAQERSEHADEDLNRELGAFGDLKFRVPREYMRSSLPRHLNRPTGLHARGDYTEVFPGEIWDLVFQYLGKTELKTLNCVLGRNSRARPFVESRLFRSIGVHIPGPTHRRGGEHQALMNFVVSEKGQFVRQVEFCFGGAGCASPGAHDNGQRSGRHLQLPSVVTPIAGANTEAINVKTIVLRGHGFVREPNFLLGVCGVASGLPSIETIKYEDMRIVSDDRVQWPLIANLGRLELFKCKIDFKALEYLLSKHEGLLKKVVFDECQVQKNPDRINPLERIAALPHLNYFKYIWPFMIPATLRGNTEALFRGINGDRGFVKTIFYWNRTRGVVWAMDEKFE